MPKVVRAAAAVANYERGLAGQESPKDGAKVHVVHLAGDEVGSGCGGQHRLRQRLPKRRGAADDD